MKFEDDQSPTFIMKNSILDSSCQRLCVCIQSPQKNIKHQNCHNKKRLQIYFRPPSFWWIKIIFSCSSMFLESLGSSPLTLFTLSHLVFQDFLAVQWLPCCLWVLEVLVPQFLVILEVPFVLIVLWNQSPQVGPYHLSALVAPEK